MLRSSSFLKAVAFGTTVQTPTPAHIVRKLDQAGWILRSSALSLAVLGLMGLGAGCAENVESSTDVDVTVTTGSEAQIFGGAKDDDRDALSSVVALKVGSEGSYELCSGVLVAPNVVLTARHCVANSITTTVVCDENGNSTNGDHVAGDHDPREVSVYLGATPKFSQKADAIGASIISPNSTHLCDTDIALVVLDKSFADIEPVAVRLNSGVSTNETIRSVGYGQNDKRLPLGTRLRKPNVQVLAMGKGISEFKTALGPHEFEVGKSICQGDSGGPAISEDTGAVVGVVSRGGDCEDDYGHIYTTTAGWKELFDAAFKVAGGAPIVESGSPVGQEPGAKPRSETSAPKTSTEVEPKPAAQSCSASAANTHGTSGATGSAAFGIALAAALVLRSRRRA